MISGGFKVNLGPRKSETELKTYSDIHFNVQLFGFTKALSLSL